MLLVLVDVLILTAYTAVGTIRGNLKAMKVPNEEHPADIVGVSTVSETTPFNLLTSGQIFDAAQKLKGIVTWTKINDAYNQYYLELHAS